MKAKLKDPENLILNDRAIESRKRITELRERASKLEESFSRFKEKVQNLGDIELTRGNPEHDAILDNLADVKRKGGDSCYSCNSEEKKLIKRELGEKVRKYCQLCNSLFIDNIFKPAEG